MNRSSELGGAKQTATEGATANVDRRIVFIAGLHRSGTSLLHRILRAHPRISSFENTGVPEDEGQHLQSVYPTAKALGGPGLFGFNPAAYMDEHHALATSQNAARLIAEWSRYWNFDADILVEKSPPNLIRMRFLQALFPQARFITLLRHPIAVACATSKWARSESLARLLEHWLVCHDQFEADRHHLRRSIVLKYEDLVQAPEEVLGELWRFLDLEPISIDEPVRKGINDHYLKAWEAQRSAFFSGRGLRRAVKRFEKRVGAYGYSLTGSRE